MNARRVLAAAGAVLLAAVLLARVPVGAQDASGPVDVSVDQVGWWTDRPGATATDDGGFEVATGGDGEPQSLAAIQLTIGAGTVDAFTISLTESTALAEFGSIAVCSVDGLWIAENPGDLDNAPATDCSTRVNLTRTTDSMTWLGDITSLVRDGGTVSLAFVPEYRPPTPVGPGMVVRIAEIGTEATGSGEAGGTGATTTTVAASPSPAPTTTPADTGAPSPQPEPATPAPSNSGAVPTPSAPDADPAGDAPPTTVAVTETEPVTAEDDFFTLGPLAERASETKPWTRLLLLVPLSAAIGVGAAWIRRLVVDRSHAAGGV